jgi:endonuclease/exonuclease/phosphatase (EEP) superfamily protein YafD
MRMAPRHGNILRVVALATFALHCGGAGGPAAPPRAPIRGAVLRLLTYNVNYGMAGDRESIAAIRDADADIVVLQETNTAWEQALRGALSKELPRMTFHTRGGAGGLAVLSRLPLAEVEFLKPTASGWFPAVRVVVEAPFGKVQVLSVHLHPPVSDAGSFITGYFTTGAIRREEIAAFVAKLSPDLPVIVAGDFNEESDGEVMKFLREKGLLSALPPGQPTWRWTTAVGTIRRQLDHILYDGRLRAVAGEVRVAGRSDHLPVLGIVQLATPVSGHR